MQPFASPATDSDERLARERSFHNKVFADDGRQVTEKYYAVDRLARRWYEEAVRRARPGMTVLDYGCSTGRYARIAAATGANVVAIDLSETAIEQAREAALQHGISNIEFRVMDAESTEFTAESFDMVFGVAILHHLDLNRALREVARILKRGGSSVFLEPLGHNPLINLYRRLTPHLRTPDEHPLLVRDLRVADEWFESRHASFFTLSALMATPLTDTSLLAPALSICESVDRTLLNALPPLRRYAWQLGIELSKPRRSDVVRGDLHRT